jgi:hypothetical protein
MRHRSIFMLGSCLLLICVAVFVGCSDDDDPTQPNPKPRAVITSPESGADYSAAQFVPLRGYGENSGGNRIYPEYLAWYLDEVHEDSLQGRGEIVDVRLPLGTHTLYLKASETDEVFAIDSVSVEILTPDNYPPVATILEPLTGETFLPAHVPTILRGRGTDVEDGSVPPSNLGWVSSLDGDLGTGTELAVGLSPGEHQLILTAIDQAGTATSDTVTVVVNHKASQPFTSGEYRLSSYEFNVIGECQRLLWVTGLGTLTVDAGTATLAITDLGGGLSCAWADICDLAGDVVEGNISLEVEDTLDDNTTVRIEMTAYHKDADTAEGLIRVVTTPPGGQSCVNRARLALLRESD